jgi:hypothetical protein
VPSSTPSTPALDNNHPLGRYLHRTTESWRVATLLLDAIGTPEVTGYSTRLFGKPGGRLPGDGPTNLEAAQHFIDLADRARPGAAPVRARLRAFRGAGAGRNCSCRSTSSWARARSASSSTRPDRQGGRRLDAAAPAHQHRLSEYDRNQLLMHEFFVHTLTGLNGREQPVLGTLARGSPRTTATQEGLATLSEMMSGSMDIERMKRISLRIIAIDMALHGADFIEVFKFFLEEGQSDVDSFTSAQRIFRGVPIRRHRVRLHQGHGVPARPAQRAHLLPLVPAPPQARPGAAAVRRQDGAGGRVQLRVLVRQRHHRAAALPAAVDPARQRPGRHARLLAVRQPHRLDNVGRRRPGAGAG